MHAMTQRATVLWCGQHTLPVTVGCILGMRSVLSAACQGLLVAVTAALSKPFHSAACAISKSTQPTPCAALFAVNATGDIKGNASTYWTQLPITGEAQTSSVTGRS
jgi:hypothetical protein